MSTGKGTHLFVRECEWCGHTGAGHMFEFPDSKQITQACQVPVMVRISGDLIMAAPCGCKKEGPKRVKVEPPPLPAPPTCMACDEFALPNSSFCSETCEARVKAFMRAGQSVTPMAVQPAPPSLPEAVIVDMNAARAHYGKGLIVPFPTSLPEFQGDQDE